MKVFWNKEKKSQEVDSIPVVTLEEPKMSPIEENVPVPSSYEAKPDLGAEEFAEYQRVAKAIGLDTQEALFNERMRHCCAVNGFRIYTASQVDKFLNRKLGVGKWEWMGLRLVDVEHLGGWHTTSSEPHIKFSKKQYGRKIPLPVLLTVQRVLEEVPGAHFYISGIPDVDDDPFLSITCRTGDQFIIERWDEPDFRDI
jgi:hypothetical protein